MCCTTRSGGAPPRASRWTRVARQNHRVCLNHRASHLSWTRVTHTTSDGHDVVEVMLTLFALALGSPPNTVFLNRGNHEDSSICAM